MKTKIQFKNTKDLPIRITDWIGSQTSLIIHTILFVGIFVLKLFKVATADILLILTTLVSLEAIYLAIFIQMTVNRNTQSLEEVEEDIDEIQEDIEVMEKDIDEIQEDDPQDAKTNQMLETIEIKLQGLIADIENIKKIHK